MACFWGISPIQTQVGLSQTRRCMRIHLVSGSTFLHKTLQGTHAFSCRHLCNTSAPLLSL